MIRAASRRSSAVCTGEQRIEVLVDQRGALRELNRERAICAIAAALPPQLAEAPTAFWAHCRRQLDQP
jgi:hypothetical protein